MAKLLPSLVALLTLFAGETIAQKAAPQPSEAAAPASPIPLTEVATRIEGLNRELRDIIKRLPEDADIAKMDEMLRKREQSLAARAGQTQNLLLGAPTSLEIRDEQRLWRTYVVVDASERKILVDWARHLQKSIETLGREETIWNATLAKAETAEGFQAVAENIRSSITEIKDTKAQVLDKLNPVLRLQNRLSQQDLEITQVLEDLDSAATAFQTRLFTRDAYPIWKFTLRRKGGQLQDALNRTLRASYAGGGDFVRQTGPSLIVIILFYAVAVFLIMKAREFFRSLPNRPAAIQEASVVLDRSLSTAAFLALVMMPMLTHHAPIGIVALVMLVFLLPLFRLLPVLLGHPRGPALYAVAGFFVFNCLLDVGEIDPVLKRNLIALLSAASLGVFIWLLHSKQMQERFRSKPAGRRAVFAIYCIIALLLITLSANFLGYFTLSQVVREAVFFSAYVGVAVYVAARILVILASAVLSLPRISSSAAIRMHGKRIEKWLDRIFSTVGFVVWLLFALELLTLRQPVLNFLSRVLNARLPLRSLNFSLGDLVSFAMVMAIGFIFARFARFFLSHEVLPRFHLAKGIPALVSSILYYSLLLVAFVAAVTAAGINLDKFTFVTGALGVGVGFGLQNLVNNFASGLILKVERPMYIGDMLEVGGISGEVTHIGVRSTTIKTPQGAEVIIPNATFISGQMTNWTRTQTFRRVEIPIATAYGSDPERVVQILVDIVSRNPAVRKNPAPFAIFNGFAPSAMNFQVLFWTEFSVFFTLQSELAMSLIYALREAGIEIPLPQCDINIREVTGEAASDALKTSAAASALPSSRISR
jgi:potassium-dependent mechanosensitive channel